MNETNDWGEVSRCCVHLFPFSSETEIDLWIPDESSSHIHHKILNQLLKTCKVICFSTHKQDYPDIKTIDASTLEMMNVFVLEEIEQWQKDQIQKTQLHHTRDRRITISLWLFFPLNLLLNNAWLHDNAYMMLYLGGIIIRI